MFILLKSLAVMLLPQQVTADMITISYNVTEMLNAAANTEELKVPQEVLSVLSGCSLVRCPE